jgi:hypothetical protein
MVVLLDVRSRLATSSVSFCMFFFLCALFVTYPAIYIYISIYIYSWISYKKSDKWKHKML